MKIHNECLPQVKERFNYMWHRNPTVDGALLWQRARDFCRTIDLIDTDLWLRDIGLKN